MDMTQPQDDARVTEDWLLTDSGETVYTLMPAGWRKGVEQHKNRYWFTVYADPSEGDGAARAMAECIHALLNIPAPEEGEHRGGEDAYLILRDQLYGLTADLDMSVEQEDHFRGRVRCYLAMHQASAPNPQPQIGETSPASDEAAKGEVERVWRFLSLMWPNLPLHLRRNNTDEKLEVECILARLATPEQQEA